MKSKADIIVIGAGASGLMAARELSKGGRSVIVLEARDRIGGRIWSLSTKKFGYPAQGGAEFVHGSAKVTKSLLKEAGLTYISTEGKSESGEMWTMQDGEFITRADFMPHNAALRKKLKKLKKDMPIAAFLKKNFPGNQFARFRASVLRMVQGYDAGDPDRMSTFSLREDWLGGGDWQQGRVEEGYGALIDFLARECTKRDVAIDLKRIVKKVAMVKNGVNVICADGKIYFADKVLVTVPLPVISSIIFDPALPKKLKAARQIGFGGVIKIVIRFKNQWWLTAPSKGPGKPSFVMSDEEVPTWWTQYPASHPVLTGWLAGPAARAHKEISSKKMLDLGLASLAHMFKIDKKELRRRLVHAEVFNWPKDPFAKGAYSYPTPETEKACKELNAPVRGKLFFAGEGLLGIDQPSATVEGALASGKAVAAQILKEE